MRSVAAEDPRGVLVCRGGSVACQRVQDPATERLARDRADDGLIAESTHRQTIFAVARRAPIVVTLNNPGPRHPPFMAPLTCLRLPHDDVDPALADPADSLPRRPRGSTHVGAHGRRPDLG